MVFLVAQSPSSQIPGHKEVAQEQKQSGIQKKISTPGYQGEMLKMQLNSSTKCLIGILCLGMQSFQRFPSKATTRRLWSFTFR
jgi:hypothetical protein